MHETARDGQRMQLNTRTREEAALKHLLLRRAPGPSLSFPAGSVQDLPIGPVPQKVPGLAQNGPRDSLFLQISFSNLPSSSPINSKKEKSKKYNTEAWEWSGPPASKLFLNTKVKCFCLHDTNPNCWMNWDSAHPQDQLPAGGGDPSALCWGVHTPCATAWLVQNASRRCWKAAPEADHGVGCNAYTPGWMRSHISRL